MECPACGSTSPDGARFCASCGHRLESREDERRVATVVFGDIVGFTTLSETLDPETVKNLVDDVFDALREVIVGFGGRVDKVVGDGIVALFGAPVAHEDDAERAVRAALKMQEAVQAYDEQTGAEIRMRIGVNTGEVLVGGFRADDDYTAMGDVVNTASRLQEHAQPGAVVVGTETHSATSSVVRYRPLGALTARGRGELVDAWLAIEPVGLPGRHRMRNEAPLIGRALEVQALTGAMTAAFDHSRSTLVLVAGDAGVGKTRLCDELVAAATIERRVTVLSGRSVPYGEANVWWPLADAFMSSMGLDSHSPTRAAAAAITASVSESFDKPVDHPSVVRATNGLLHLFGHPGPLDDIDPQRAQAEAGRAVRTHIQGLAEHDPVVLWLDDLHWADRVMLAMVDALLARMSRRPFVLLAATRFDLYERWSPKSGRHNVVSIGLDPLGIDGAVELVDALVDETTPRALRGEVVTRSGGNPFVIEELVALLTGEGALDTGSLPGTVRGLTAARLDRLTREEKRVLEDAAVLGRSGTLAGLEQTAAIMRGRGEIADVLRSLADKDLLTVGGGRWSFRSDVTREVAYDRLTKTERARRHAGMAAYLEEHFGARVTAQIADHYRRAAELSVELGGLAGVPDDVVERAVASIRQAVTRASGDEAYSVSLRLIDQALGLVSDDELRATLLLDRAGIRLRQRDRDGARRDLDRAAGIIGEQAQTADAARALRLRGDLDSWSDDPGSAFTSLRRAAMLSEQLGDEAGVAEARRLEGVTHLFIGGLSEADACFTEAVRRFEAADDPRGAAWAMQNLAWVSYSEGLIDESERRINRSIEAFTRLSDQAGLAWARGLLAYLRMYQGRLDEAEEMAQGLVIDASERGDPWSEAMMIVLQASVRLWSGRPVEAVELASEAVAVFERLADTLGVSQARAVLGRAMVRSGRVDEGLAALGSAADASGLVGTVGSRGAVAAAAARTGLGEPDAALALIGSTRDQDVTLIGESDRRVTLGLALLQLGQVRAAEAALDSVVDTDEPGPNALAARALCAAVTGDAALVARLAGQVAASSAATYLDRAQASVARALIAGRASDLGAALDALDSADALVPSADRVGCFVLATARALVLAAAGGTPEAREVADARVVQYSTELGRSASGWRHLFSAALTGDGQLGALV